jgi:glycosyltransferase involved in cell wall biosynthesis
MSRRLVVLSEIIAPYRIPVFNALARRQDIDLHVIFLAESDPELRDWLVYKDEIRFSYQVLPSWRKHFAGHNLLLNRGLRQALEKAKPEAVLCGGYNYLASWQAARWADRNTVPFILWAESTDRDIRSRYPAVEFLKTKFINNCSAFVVPGKASREYVMNYGVCEQRIFTAPNAVDTELFASQADAVRQDASRQRQTLNLPERFFLFVGRLVREKGVGDLLAAYGKMASEIREAVALVLVGEGSAHTELVQLATKITPGEVYFPGFVHREQLAAYYGLAEAFVFPSHTDTWGMVVNEAMACSLPIISSDAAGCTADLVQENWNGRVVRRGDVAQIASAMADLARDRSATAVMGVHSRARILEYSPEACAAGIARAAFACGVSYCE